jgi:predicted amidohydrolase
MAAARVNRMAVACADRLGTERGVEWTGGATIVGVDGWVAAERPDVGLLVADVDLSEALEKRLTDHADAFGDRRPDIYAALASG